ncbi:DUF6883 domain-containing protein [Leptolyngbya sp. NIES-2104]|uniref:DUF6883 domain-containing protein n=1 Tax=Leptolyngbya sp. NIES-2104 TaxID=1552121 RepID=UPI0006EC6E7A|nr:DUF6883 domain-containing protein [Leptolyngbya sp. NIES-2104]GAP97377.1 hypothetical protein NIES2104_39240 [Leptolyngbya sp. NIES-2104]
MNWTSGDPLPNAENAEIDPRKFVEYSMSPDNPNNQGKWIAFEALGYPLHPKEDRTIAAQMIIEQLKQAILTAPATSGKLNSHGQRFTVSINLQGLNQRQGQLVCVWQIDHNRDVPRLITTWLEVYQDPA